MHRLRVPAARDGWHRVVGALVAAGVTVSLGLPFLGVRPPETVFQRSAAVRVSLQAPGPEPERRIAARPTDPADRPPVPRDLAPRQRQPGPPAPEAIALPGTVTADPPTTAAAPEPAQATASAPLRLDAAVMRKANAASRSELRRLGDTAGTPAPDTIHAGETPLSQGIASAGKPDCVRPGASLLSPLIVAYEALRDRCR